MDQRRTRPSQLGFLAAPLRFLAVPLAVGMATLWGPTVLAASSVAKVLTSCSFTALKNAVAAGGTVDYGVNCQSSPVSFTATITVPTGRTVDVQANGHSVTFDGGGTVRLFEVTGGKLTIGSIALNNAVASTADGKAGGTGGAGTSGANGSTGANGPSGTSPAPERRPGPGRPGRWHGHGGQGGRRRQERPPGQGAALLITSGTVTLTNDMFASDIASAVLAARAVAAATAVMAAPGGHGGTGGAGAGGAAQRCRAARAALVARAGTGRRAWSAGPVAPAAPAAAPRAVPCGTRAR